MTSLVAQPVKYLLIMLETWVQSLGQEDLLEKEMATHSSILAWKTPWMEEAGRLQSIGHKELDRTERLHFHFQTNSFKMPLTPEIHTFSYQFNGHITFYQVGTILTVKRNGMDNSGTINIDKGCPE